MQEEIFVFGSNLAGRHGAGSAREAFKNHGAQYGVGEGRTGRAYAIPTKDWELATLSPIEISWAVTEFLKYAQAHPELKFNVVRIGCGLAGYNWERDIKPMFAGMPDNVHFLEP